LPVGDPLHVVVDEGLGNAAYLVDLGDGRALAVDPSTDLRALRNEARRRGLSIAYVAETHLHADFLSGACRLAASDGATILASRAGGRAFEHVGLADGDEVDLGGLVLRGLSTPGHTDEHTAFLLLDDDRPLGVFSGGSLLVDAVARTDLVDPDRVEELARAQYRSVRRLLELPDETALWPTHGTGSFCASPPGADRTSTIGHERTTGSLARASDEESFVKELMGSLGSFPPYFLRLPERNRVGVRDVPSAIEPLDAAAVARLREAGATVVDARMMGRFAVGHVPGSLSIELRPAFATWVGWLDPAGAAVVVVRDADQDPEEIRAQAAKVGVQLAGELTGGIEAWQSAGMPVASIALHGPEDVRAAQLVDVRQDSELAAEHVQGSRHVELGTLADAELPAGPLVLMCGHGERAMTGASLLEAAGRHDVSVMVGGPSEWARANGVTASPGA